MIKADDPYHNQHICQGLAVNTVFPVIWIKSIKERRSSSYDNDQYIGKLASLFRDALRPLFRCYRLCRIK